jgi:hypothetical protein
MPLLQSSLSMSDIALHAMITLALLVAVLWLRRWPLVYACSILPGTIAHELLHFLAGWVSGAKPTSLSIIPRIKTDGGWVLGSVVFTNLRWWNSPLVGLAPLALLPCSVYLFFASMPLPLLSISGAGIKLVAVQFLIAGWPSPTDWAHAIIGLVVTMLFTLAGFLLITKLGIL